MNFYSQFEKYSLPLFENGVKLPSFNIEDKWKEEYKLPKDCSSYEFLLQLCLNGLDQIVGKSNPRFKEYQKRMNDELQVFNELGFCSYLLITWDIVNFCRKNKIAIGRGRGSAGNSLVLYLISVTKVDSLKLNLYFERFLNKIRAKFKEIEGIKYYSGSLLFDIDLDIGDRRPVIQYLDEKYKGKIAKLPTVNTYTTKTLIKESCKFLLEINEESVNQISDTVPLEFNKPLNFEKSYAQSKEFKEFADNNPEIIKISKRFFEQWKFTGVHPSAWVITSDPIDEIFPLRLTKDGDLCTCYTMDDSLDLAIKIDLLSLRCATLIERVCELVKIKPEEIDVNDPLIYESLQNLTCPHGLFQIESEANYRVLKTIKPTNLEQLMAVVSLVRPGCSQFIDVYKKYKETGEFQSVHPFFDEVLQVTAGIPLYQESLLRMANKVGFSLAESESIRKCLGKKLIEEMGEWEQKVKDKIKENNLSPEIGDILWKIMDDSKNYSFNAGHAAAYASMCAATTYLKFKYPKEFFLCLLNLTKDEPDSLNEIASIQNEIKNFGLQLLGPDIMKSHIDFSIEGNDIRFGLGSIKGVAQKSFEKLQNFKHEYSNKLSVFLSAEESGINIGILSALIMSGSLNNYISESRSKSTLEAQTWSLLTEREKKKVLELGEKFNYKLFDILKYLKEHKNEKGKPFIKESRILTIRKKYDKYKAIYHQNSKYEKLSEYWYEKALIGYSYSHRLCDIIKEHYPQVIPIEEAKTALNEEELMICGEIQDVLYSTSKKKNKYCKLRITDGTGSIDCLIFNYKRKNGDLVENIEEMELQNGGKFQEGWIVVCDANKKTDSVFCSRVIRQDVKIMTKLSDLKNEKVEKDKNSLDKQEDKV